MTDTPERNIGGIGNYYGGLYVKEQDGRFWWSILNYDGQDWEEIPNWLFDALVKFDIFGVGHTEENKP